MILATLLSATVLGQVALPGSNLSLEQAREKARLIVVAEVVGPSYVAGSGPFSFMTLGLKPLAVLKGAVKEGELKQVGAQAVGKESPPRAGEEYIVFIHDYRGSPNIHKMLPKTEENLAAVKAGAETKSRSDVEQEKKAAEWVAALKLDDPAKEARLRDVITTHLRAVRDWHNAHPFTAVPAGINPATGRPLSNLDRQVIADSAQPKSVHEHLMAGLRKDLSPEQVEAILDRYTVGKVAFTLKGYRAIVPDLTRDEEATILGFLKQAREEAVDFKNMNEISAIFEIYKTKSEQYLNAHGRDWKALYKAYTDAVRARKAATRPAPEGP